MEIIPLESDGVFEKVVSAVSSGAIVAFPTDTVYGFIADATKEEAIEAIFRIKKRDTKKALGTFMASIPMVEEYAEVPAEYYEGLSQLWPGSLTAVLQSKNVLPKMLHESTPHIGVRIPNHILLLEIIRYIGKPLIQTSLNISGESVLWSVAEITQQFLGSTNIAYVVDGFISPDTIQSTGINLVVNPPQIFRKGGVSKEQLEEVFQKEFVIVANI